MRSQRAPSNENASAMAKSMSRDKPSRNRLRARKKRVRTVASGISSAAATSSTLISSTARSMNTVRNASGSKSMRASISGAAPSASPASGSDPGRPHRSIPALAVDRFHYGLQRDDLRIAPAHPTKRFVDDDAHQPGGQFRVGAKRRQRPPRAQIGFLQRIFGFGVALQNAARGSEQQPVVAPHDRSKAIRRPCGASDEVDVGRGGR